MEFYISVLRMACRSGDIVFNVYGGAKPIYAGLMLNLNVLSFIDEEDINDYKSHARIGQKLDIPDFDPESWKRVSVSRLSVQSPLESAPFTPSSSTQKDDMKSRGKAPMLVQPDVSIGDDDLDIDGRGAQDQYYEPTDVSQELGEEDSPDRIEEEVDIKPDIEARRFIQRIDDSRPRFVHTVIPVINLDSDDDEANELQPSEAKRKGSSNISGSTSSGGGKRIKQKTLMVDEMLRREERLKEDFQKEFDAKHKDLASMLAALISKVDRLEASRAGQGYPPTLITTPTPQIPMTPTPHINGVLSTCATHLSAEHSTQVLNKDHHVEANKTPAFGGNSQEATKLVVNCKGDGEDALEVVGAGVEDTTDHVNISLISSEKLTGSGAIEEAVDKPPIPRSEDVSGKVIPDKSAHSYYEDKETSIVHTDDLDNSIQQQV